MEKEKKRLMNIGQIDKYITFILLGGASQCICSTMLYIFKDVANYNQHTIIIGFNASIGMSFAFIPFLIEKIKMNKSKKKIIFEQVPSLKGHFFEEEKKETKRRKKNILFY